MKNVFDPPVNPAFFVLTRAVFVIKPDRHGQHALCSTFLLASGIVLPPGTGVILIDVPKRYDGMVIVIAGGSVWTAYRWSVEHLWDGS